MEDLPIDVLNGWILPYVGNYQIGAVQRKMGDVRSALIHAVTGILCIHSAFPDKALHRAAVHCTIAEMQVALGSGQRWNGKTQAAIR